MKLRARVFVKVVVFSWLTRWLLSWLLTLPLIAGVAATGFRDVLDGDRALFEPGGLYFLELLRLGHLNLTASLRPYLIWFCLAWLFTIFCNAFTFAWLSKFDTLAVSPEPGFRRALLRAAQVWPRFVGIGLLELLLKGLVLVAASLIAAGLSQVFGSSNDRQKDIFKAIAFLLLLSPAGVLCVLADAVRAECLRPADGSGQPLTALLRGAGATCRAHFPTLASGYVLNTGCALFVIAVGARLVEACDVSQPGAARWLLAGLIHQAVVLGLVAARTAFSARVIQSAEQPVSLQDAPGATEALAPVIARP